MSSAQGPTHSLGAVQRAVGRGDISLASPVMGGASDLYLDYADIEACLLALAPGDFYKTMPSERRPGRMQDVYKHRYHGFPIYLKFDFDASRGRVILLSFKRDESV